MDETLVLLLLGLYGYVAFALVLHTAKKTLLGKSFFWPETRRYTDVVIGLVSLLYSTRVSQSDLRFITALYGLSLLANSLRGPLGVGKWNVGARKAFNYLANSYIVLSLFLMAPAVKKLTGVEPVLILIPLFLGTYYVVWGWRR
ncbi:hypothetical protein [Thermococcus nautili]|uniref:Uncharacterized protein n=1 Tax=Thermococcus nautili TaxID=195522 RepID=W8P315_9EURY|nr:hypothetical protein [Thermococcus nautili]AHL23181.1 hypothetical protein BD01_1576 [Thermococcus nautili]CAI1492848.1 conserved membrane protein of unknown function [Thermococcus nautili]